MDIAALSIMARQGALAQNVSLALTRKVMDVAGENSVSLIKMMEQSANPNLGKNLDIKV